MQNVFLGTGFPVINIEQVGKQLEGKEGNTDGQCQMKGRKIFLQ